MEESKTAILIIEDDSSMSGFLGRALESRGFAATVARSAEEFLSKVLLEPFELALIDVNLPGMDGITLTREIKARACTCDIIIMTGDPNLENAIGAIKAGAYDYLVKPFSDEMLHLTVTLPAETKTLPGAYKHQSRQGRNSGRLLPTASA